MINKFCIILPVVNQILLINQKYSQMNHNKFLEFVYEFEFQNALVNLY